MRSLYGPCQIEKSVLGWCEYVVHLMGQIILLTRYFLFLHFSPTSITRKKSCYYYHYCWCFALKLFSALLPVTWASCHQNYIALPVLTYLKIAPPLPSWCILWWWEIGPLGLCSIIYIYRYVVLLLVYDHNMKCYAYSMWPTKGWWRQYVGIVSLVNWLALDSNKNSTQLDLR